MPYRFALALAALLFASPAAAWSVQCEVDDFTDEEICDIHVVDLSSGRSFFNISLTDDGEHLTFTAGDRDTLYTDTFLIRVDDNSHWDLKDTSLSFSSDNRGFVVAGVRAQQGKKIVREMIAGDELKVRLSEYNGPNQDATFFTFLGLEEAWNEFREEAGF